MVAVAVGCSRTVAVVVVPASREVKLLPNGNYEVTAAWLQERYEVERSLKDQLDNCKKGK